MVNWSEDIKREGIEIGTAKGILDSALKMINSGLSNYEDICKTLELNDDLKKSLLEMLQK